MPGSTDAISPSARFNKPYGVALNALGTLALVADTGNSTIRRIDVLSGTVTTLAYAHAHNHRQHRWLYGDCALQPTAGYRHGRWWDIRVGGGHQ